MASSMPRSLSHMPQLRSSKNKELRKAQFVKHKRARDSLKRDERFRRKREEDADPKLKERRLARNIPITIDKKRVWDEADVGNEDKLGLSVDVERTKRRKIEEGLNDIAGTEQTENREEIEGDDDADSMLDPNDSEEAESGSDTEGSKALQLQEVLRSSERASSVASTSTNLDLAPESLRNKFPALFEPPSTTKVLITTSLNSTLHDQASILTRLFPNSTYVPRSGHRYAHKFSVTEISKFAANRGFTTLMILNEDLKRPHGLDVVHLPAGPMFHFSITNWIDGKKLPGHGNPTNHHPELILNNFRTPLGLLTAHLFRTMFPPQPEFEGRQVVTLHNQRDYIFVRRHRYVFRDKRKTEKSVVDTDGKPMKGVESIRTGLQELGPRLTLKLRRVDKGIQRRSGQEWEWKAGMEKQRTRFQL